MLFMVAISHKESRKTFYKNCYKNKLSKRYFYITVRAINLIIHHIKQDLFFHKILCVHKIWWHNTWQNAICKEKKLEAFRISVCYHLKFTKIMCKVIKKFVKYLPHWVTQTVYNVCSSYTKTTHCNFTLVWKRILLH